MRNFWAIILCISICGPFASGQLLIHFFQFLHRHHIQAKISSNRLDHELVTLHFSEAEFASLEWEHEKEFEWSGKMYDVKAINVSSGGFEVICWPDEKDSMLFVLKNPSVDSNLQDVPIPLQTKQQPTPYKIQLDIPGCGFSLDCKTIAVQPTPAYTKAFQHIFTHEPPTPPPDCMV